MARKLYIYIYIQFFKKQFCWKITNNYLLKKKTTNTIYVKAVYLLPVYNHTIQQVRAIHKTLKCRVGNVCQVLLVRSVATYRISIKVYVDGSDAHILNFPITDTFMKIFMHTFLVQTFYEKPFSNSYTSRVQIKKIKIPMYTYAKSHIRSHFFLID